MPWTHTQIIYFLKATEVDWVPEWPLPPSILLNTPLFLQSERRVSRLAGLDILDIDLACILLVSASKLRGFSLVIGIKVFNILVIRTAAQIIVRKDVAHLSLVLQHICLTDIHHLIHFSSYPARAHHIPPAYPCLLKP